jgi:Collagenase NC10 and Endostatin
MSPRHPLSLAVVGAAALAALPACREDTPPLPLGTKIVLVALNEAHTGDLGGLAGADALCVSQAKAAGREETYMAFLSAGSRDVRALIGSQMVDSVKVENSKGEELYTSWRHVFDPLSLTASASFYTFDGKRVATSSGAGDGWHGSEPDGTERSGYTCRGWTSARTADQGANGEVDQRRLMKQEVCSCSSTLAVVCVGVAKPPSYGPCPTPGQPCKTSDPCAVNPTCGDDKQCRPSQVISCDDSLVCTVDSCDGKGGCLHKLSGGWCQIGGICYPDGGGDPSGCNRCDVSKSTTAWTPLTNGCIIGSKCYKSGEHDLTGCQICDPIKNAKGWIPRTDAHCKVSGNCYSKGYKHPQACAECAAMGVGVDWKVDSGFCLIDNKCLLSGVKDHSGCKECDPSASQLTWTPIKAACLIEGKCLKQGEQHPQGCAHCDATKNASGWTPLGGACIIDKQCHASGAKIAGGCAYCDPASSLTDWKVDSGFCLINHGCHQVGALDPVGCSMCDPTVSSTAWTPVPGCFKIVLTALNNAHDGALGGTATADALCAAQAKATGYGGTYRAFLSSSTQNVKDLITGSDAALPVLNTHGQQLYPSWTLSFSGGSWASGRYLYAFDGKKVDENTGAVPTWYDARGWTGSTTAGLVSPNQTCQDWTSAAGLGASGELDMRRLLYTYTNSCNQTLAVVCVRVK